MKNKNVVMNIFWGDDEYKKKIKENQVNNDFLEDNNINADFFVSSKDLLTALEKPNSLHKVDAVIFDYNMPYDSLYPVADDKEKSGFLHILRELPKYVSKGIPFYLWSKMPLNLITESLSKNPDLKQEYGIFKEYIYNEKVKRFLPDSSFKEILNAVQNEVRDINRPQFRIKYENPTLYAICNEVSTTCWGVVARVLQLEKDGRMSHESFGELLNAMRCEVESLLDSLHIPLSNSDSGIRLSAFHSLISGTHYNYELVSKELENPTLGNALKLVMEFMQDGSHQGKSLTFKLREYLDETRDYHLVLFIAHALIRIILWADKAKKYLLAHEEINDKIYKLRNDSHKESKPSSIQGKIELDEDGIMHVEDCVVGNFQIGDMVENDILKNDNIRTNTSASAYKYPYHAYFHKIKKI